MAPTRAPAGAPRALLALVTATVVVVGTWAAVAVASREHTATLATDLAATTVACKGAARDLDLTTPSGIGVIPLSDRQVTNAETIVATTRDSGRSRAAAVIALTAAMQESALLNIEHGDEAGPDSRGLFQQRLQFFEDVDVMDPVAATLAFLEGLDAVDGWEQMAPYQAIQSVQRAAHPERYGDWVEPAQEWVDVLWTYTEACEQTEGASGEGGALLSADAR